MNHRLDVVQRAATAYRDLAGVAETVDDEWQYVNDLVDAYLPGIEALGEGNDPTDAQLAAVEEAIVEIGLITDPHKAIDWLSTFPHVVALAIGVDPAAAYGGPELGAR